ncbi:CRE-UGT-54 protein [Aphelenchoides avenae]|nr:CRE-UGT-54 protein [Aphelenchus avenae]
MKKLKHFVIAVWDPRVTTNGSEKAHRIIRYAPRDTEGFNMVLSRIAFKQDHFNSVGDAFGREQMQNMVAINKFYGDDVLSNAAFLDGLRKERYDIGVAEAIDATAHEMFRVLRIKTTFATSATALSSMSTSPLGLPQPPSFVPDINDAPPSAPFMSYWERAHSLYRGPNWPDNMRRASFHFINSNEVLDMARPVSHKVKYIGGAAMPRAKPLEGELLEVVDRARSGVIFFSFGSIVDTESMPAEVRDAFLRSFAKFPEFEFVWKFAGPGGNVSHYFDAYQNVHAFKWVDQVSLLANPKTKAFITHCGMNSLQEAAHYGVPLIAVPFFGDQTYNAAVMRHRGIGVCLSKTELTETAVTEALRSVLVQERSVLYAY